MIVLDTTILVYASEGSIRCVGHAREVIGEFVHVRARRCDRADAADRGRELLGLLQPLLAPGEPELALGLRLFEEHPTLGAFDAVLAAATMLSGADAIVSADRAFAGIRGLAWMDPAGPQLRDLLTG